MDFYTSGPFANLYLSTFLLYSHGLIGEMSSENSRMLFPCLHLRMCEAVVPSLLEAETVGLPALHAHAGVLPAVSACPPVFLLPCRNSGRCQSPWPALRAGGRWRFTAAAQLGAAFLPPPQAGDLLRFSDLCGWLGLSKAFSLYLLEPLTSSQ